MYMDIPKNICQNMATRFSLQPDSKLILCQKFEDLSFMAGTGR